MGYYLLQQHRVKDSLTFLKFVTEEYPQSFNAFDSYGEALLKDGQLQASIKMYRQSLQLNPDNTNATAQLKKLGQQSE